MMRFFLVSLLLLVSFPAKAEMKFWYGFENAAYGTSLNAYTAIAPDYRVNTGYAWVNTANICGVIEEHKIAPFAGLTVSNPWYPHLGYGATFPITATAKLSVSGNNIPIGIMTRYRNDITSYTNAGIGAFIKATAGNLAVGVGTIDSSGTWVSISSTAAIYPINFDQLYELTVYDPGGPGGATLCAYFDSGSNTPTTLRVEKWVASNATYPPYLKCGITRGGAVRANFFDDFRMNDALSDDTPTFTPTFTPTPTVTKTPTPFHPIPGITPIPKRMFMTWRPDGSPPDFWVGKWILSSTGNTLTIANVIRWTESVVCADGTTIDCTGNTLTMVRMYPQGTFNYDPLAAAAYPPVPPIQTWGNWRGEHTGELSTKIKMLLNRRHGYPTFYFSDPTDNNCQTVDTRGSWGSSGSSGIYGGVSMSTGTVLFTVKPMGTPPQSSSQTDLSTLPGPIGGESGNGRHQGIARGKLSPGGPYNQDKIWGFSYDTDYRIVPISYTIDEWVTIGWLHRDGGLYAWKNGVYIGVSDTCGDMPYTNGGTKFGANTYANGSFEGEIQSIVFFTEALTDPEMKIALDYLDAPDMTATPTTTASPNFTPTPISTATATPTVTPTATPTRTCTPVITLTPSASSPFWGISVPLRVKRPTTQSVTTISNTYTSNTEWVKLINSDVCTGQKFYISEPSGTYDFYITYNPLTYTVVDNYVLWNGKSTSICRTGYTPNGVWVKVTFPAVCEEGPAIKIRYETWGSRSP
jgi:hypothetical protein